MGIVSEPFAVWGALALCAATVGPGGGGGEPGVRPQALRPQQVVVLSYDDAPEGLGLLRCGRGYLGARTFAVSRDGEIMLADPVNRRIKLYSRLGTGAGEIGYPGGYEVLGLASDPRHVYALCARVTGEVACCRAHGTAEAALRRLSLVTYVRETRSWKLGPDVPLKQPAWAGGGRPGEEPVRGDRFGKRGTPVAAAEWLRLGVCRDGLYLYDPEAGVSVALAKGGEVVDGWMLQCGARALAGADGLVLVWPSGSRTWTGKDWRYLIGADLSGNLFAYTVDTGGLKPKIVVELRQPEGQLIAAAELPPRPGRVRVQGPRVIVGDDGELYEFWSSVSQLRIVRWSVRPPLRRVAEAGSGF